MTGSRRVGEGLFALRIALGTVFLLHGWSKLFGNEISFFREMLGMAGWSMPEWLLVIVALVEVLAGLALLLGFLASLSSAVLAFEMIVAVFLFHLREGFFIVAVPNVPLAYGFEYHLVLLGGLVCLTLSGPGRWALGGPALRLRRSRGGEPKSVDAAAEV